MEFQRIFSFLPNEINFNNTYPNKIKINHVLINKEIVLLTDYIKHSHCFDEGLKTHIINVEFLRLFKDINFLQSFLLYNFNN